MKVINREFVKPIALLNLSYLTAIEKNGFSKFKLKVIYKNLLKLNDELVEADVYYAFQEALEIINGDEKVFNKSIDQSLRLIVKKLNKNQLVELVQNLINLDRSKPRLSKEEKAKLNLFVVILGLDSSLLLKSRINIIASLNKIII